MDLKMYILVNKDIEIDKGKLGGQIGHVVASYFYRYFRPESPIYHIFDEYMEIQKKILLAAPQVKLEQLENLGYITIRDLGLTDLVAGTLTCVNVGIIDSDSFPEDMAWLKKLKLYR